ncbi:HAMP domain-containing sensor histidine kinase [Sphaerisporangium rufum]|uniref:HAMP domain-containing sensor histidine kinase n=1 Tax=Sphaerisporangium rufum TaxID=1381558 RepID=UPI001EF2652B|nr:HAMP domain-containing sensor histidine kinase [Sphaerisporangium rufum]
MRLWRDWSARARLAWVIGTMTALACAGVSALILVHERELATVAVRERVTAAELRLARLIARDRLPAVLATPEPPLLQVLDERRRVVSASPRLAGRPPVGDLVPPDDAGTAERTVCRLPAFPDSCLLLVAMRFYRPGGNWLIYGADRAVPWYVSPGMAALLGGGSLILVGATALGAYGIVRWTLAPVRDLCRRLAEITASDPSLRVPLSPHRDELRDLAESMNQMLDRVQEAVQRQGRFASDASHDLRSPITAMRAQLEDALLHPADTDWPMTAEALVLSLDRLQAIVTDLLVLTRLESGEKVSRDYINLAELVRTEVGRRFRGKRVALDLQPGVVVSGDRLQLVRLLTNLLDNAERHALSTVTVLVCRQDDLARLEVVDDGAGIAPEQREVVFQRFTRLAAGRERDKLGTGLGLAIARDIAEQHGGTLTIEDSPGGARFVLRMPILLPQRPAGGPATVPPSD